ncbi:hypothetical protein C7Y66_15855 [Chroococcidiopsis sp. CCALA 051]|nr:hypothetical protein C7Y66_15855 [Chroococcidiopsis sp. CCALA 051]
MKNSGQIGRSLGENREQFGSRLGAKQIWRIIGAVGGKSGCDREQIESKSGCDWGRSGGNTEDKFLTKK